MILLIPYAAGRVGLPVLAAIEHAWVAAATACIPAARQLDASQATAPRQRGIQRLAPLPSSGRSLAAQLPAPPQPCHLQTPRGRRLLCSSQPAAAAAAAAAPPRQSSHPGALHVPTRGFSNQPETAVYSGPSTPSPKRFTLRQLRAKHRAGTPITMVTAYDYPSAVHVITCQPVAVLSFI